METSRDTPPTGKQVSTNLQSVLPIIYSPRKISRKRLVYLTITAGRGRAMPINRNIGFNLVWQARASTLELPPNGLIAQE